MTDNPNRPARRLQVDLLAMFGLLAAMVVGSLWFARLQAGESAAVARLLLTERSIGQVLSASKDGEIGQRGYLLTGQRIYLEPYLDASRRALQSLDELDRAEDPYARAAARRLRPIVAVKFAELAETLRLNDSGQPRAAVDLVRSGKGRLAMATIRAEVVRVRDLLRRRIADGQTKARVTGRWLIAGLVAGLVAIVAIGLIGLRLHLRQLAALHSERDRAEAAYQRLLAESEARGAAEGQVRQLQKMESVGQLTGGIAHDFNNMLAIVIGSLDIAQRRADDRDRVARCIANAREGAERAAALTSRLLAFSRQQPLAPVAVNANRLVAGMSDLLHRTLGEQTAIETVLAGGLWSSYADIGQLESALVNLAVNARDAMPDGGKLTIETANGHLDDAYARVNEEVTPGQYVTICVTDTGTGMPREVIDKAFDPFFTTKEVGKGTGLGLSQVFGFAKQSGGHVAIYSEVGHGTTVKLYLPRHHAEPAGMAAAPALDTLPEGRPEEIILVVEDEQRVRHFSVDALRDLGYSAISAPSPEAALRMLDEQPSIALLFTDVVMPGMDGRQLAERARERRPDLKVLYTTGYTRNAVVHNGMLDTGVAFLPKPFTVAALAIKVRETIDGGGVNRPV